MAKVVTKNKATKKITTKKAASKTEKAVEIPRANFKFAKVTIQGTSPLLVSHFDAKSIREIEEKQQGKAKNKKEFRDPVSEFKASLYPLNSPKGKVKYGIPTVGLKKAAVSACSFTTDKKTVTNGAFHVLAEDGGWLTPVKGSEPVMDERMVRVGPWSNKVAMPRYRARFDNWECTFPVQYNSSVISLEQILNLYENAGFSVGLCEWRPEKSGCMGMFKVKRG